MKFTRRWVFGAQRTEKRYQAALADRGFALKQTPRFNKDACLERTSAINFVIASWASGVMDTETRSLNAEPAAERSESHDQWATEIVVLAKPRADEERKRTGSTLSTGGNRGDAKTARSKT